MKRRIQSSFPLPFSFDSLHVMLFDMYRLQKLLCLPLIILILSGVSCGSPDRSLQSADSLDEPTVIARVNDRTFTDGDLSEIDPVGTLGAEELGRIVDHWIERELLLMIFDELKLGEDTVVQRQLEAARNDAALQAIGDRFRRESASETEARRRLYSRVEELKRTTRIERYDWRVE